MEMKFYKCAISGQIVAIVEGTVVPLVCCGEEMEELIPFSVDASHEKHVPVIEVDGDTVTVTVGSAPHPMTRNIPSNRFYCRRSSKISARRSSPAWSRRSASASARATR